MKNNLSYKNKNNNKNKILQIGCFFRKFITYFPVFFLFFRKLVKKIHLSEFLILIGVI